MIDEQFGHFGAKSFFDRSISRSTETVTSLLKSDSTTQTAILINEADFDRDMSRNYVLTHWPFLQVARCTRFT